MNKLLDMKTAANIICLFDFHDRMYEYSLMYTNFVSRMCTFWVIFQLLSTKKKKIKDFVIITIL